MMFELSLIVRVANITNFFCWLFRLLNLMWLWQFFMFLLTWNIIKSIMAGEDHQLLRVNWRNVLLCCCHYGNHFLSSVDAEKKNGNFILDSQLINYSGEKHYAFFFDTVVTGWFNVAFLHDNHCFLSSTETSSGTLILAPSTLSFIHPNSLSTW